MKELLIKSYNSDNEFIKIITDATFDNFRKSINGGIGDLTIRLARKIDTFNENGDVSLGNKIEIYVIDEDSDSGGDKIYTGWVEQQNILLDGGEEFVNIVCLGLLSKIKNDVLKDSAQTTLYTDTTDGLTTVSATAAEIADVIKAIIDKYNAVNSAFGISYNPGGTFTVEDCGNDMNYQFVGMKYLDAIEKCREVAPQDWHWYIDEEGVIYFKTISGEADHTFLLNKHIKRITASRNLDSVKNILLFYCENAGNTYKEYKDDTSISLYGRRIDNPQSDSKVSDTATMDNIGNSYIAEKKDPKIRLEMEIIDNNESDKGYDIESIDPGDTCKIVGVDADENIFGENMIIKEVIWELNKATLIVETENDFDINKYLLKINKELQRERIDGLASIPDSYS